MTTDRTIGIELELPACSIAVADLLGLDIECYHSGIDPADTSNGYWKAEHDCTVSGEFITRPLTLDELPTALWIMGDALATVRPPAWVDDIEAGNHVHVFTDDLGPRARARARRIYYAYQDQLGDVAAAGIGYVRDYNQPMAPASHYGGTPDWWDPANNSHLSAGYGAPWLRESTSTGCTWEFRLWNYTRQPWRLHLHAGLSLAIIEAAANGADVNDPDYADRTPLPEFIAPHADTLTLKYLRLHLAAQS